MSGIKNYVKNEVQMRVATPQTLPTPGRTDEVRNAAGGYVFSVTDRQRLARFLILGTDGGTYYIGEHDLTKQNVDFLLKMIATDEAGVVSVIEDVRVNNRAAKQSPTIFATALVLIFGQNKTEARRLVNVVCKTSTQLFEFVDYIDSLGGWGSAKRKAVAEWYTSKSADQLALQVVKYRSRSGWTHRDVFRLVHPVGVDTTVGDFILGKDTGEAEARIIVGFKAMQAATTINQVLNVLDQYPSLPWETIPTQFLTDKRVWQKLFYAGALGQTALLRNVTRFAKIGAFDDLVFAGDVAIALADSDKIAKGRMHPVQYANALGVYTKGTAGPGSYGWDQQRSRSWTTNAKIAGALEAGFYESFKAVTPANKATMIAIDVSASMTWGAPAGLVGMNYMEAAAIMAMVTARTEPYCMVTAFATTFQSTDISDQDSLNTVMAKLQRLQMGGTDIAQPMIYAKRNNLGIDTFAVYSDMETWAGATKPFQALRDYRQSSGRDAKLIAVGLASTNSSVVGPTDKGSLNVVGFDSAAPKVMADFSAGRI